MNSMTIRTAIKPTLKLNLKLNLKMRQSLAILSMSSENLKKHLHEKLRNSPFITMSHPTSKSFSPVNMIIDNRASNKRSLRNILTDQLRYQVTGKQLEIGQYIIDSLDNKGYLIEPIEDIAISLDCKIEDIEAVLAIVQQFEPAGIAARSPSESLLIQLKILYPTEDTAKSIIKNGSDVLEKYGWTGIKDMLDFSDDEVMHARKILESLNPYPGLQYDDEPENSIEPEAAVWIEDGKINISMNRFYEVGLYQIDTKTLDKTEKSEYAEAKELVNFVSQRKRSIEKIIRIVAGHQKQFFITGDPAVLSPLSLENVAQKADCHISTVSRAIADKYLSTSHGSVELKNLFIRSAGVNNISRQIILDKIEKLIKNESPENRLSDKDIMIQLKKEDILLVRRTVAKYRSILGIKNAGERNSKK